jgi:Tol biopolymer transport system component
MMRRGPGVPTFGVVILRFRTLVGALLVSVVLVAAGVAVGRRADAAVAQTTLVSSTAAGVVGDAESGDPSVSRDGTLVAFASAADNLDPYDTNSRYDVYVKNLTTGAMELVSVDMSGVAAGGSQPDISADGRYVAFTSASGDIVKGDTRGEVDVFVRDLSANATQRVSVNNSGDEVHGYSNSGSISGDGRYVVFTSGGTNLPDAGLPNPPIASQVYLRDTVAGTTVRVSSDATDPAVSGNHHSDHADISDDGRFVAYDSWADNLGRTPDNNHAADVFWWDRRGLTPAMRVSVAGRNTESNLGGHSILPSISANGRYVAFTSYATNFGGVGVQVYVRDVTTASTQVVSKSSQGFPANQTSEVATISGDGRYVAFGSDATNLIGNDTNGQRDVFVRDMLAKKTIRVSVASTGAEAILGASREPAISADGTHVAFSSMATNLTAADGNFLSDVFITPMPDPEPLPTRTGDPLPTPTYVPRP